MDAEDIKRALREDKALSGRQNEFLSSARTVEEAGDVPLLEPFFARHKLEGSAQTVTRQQVQMALSPEL